MPRSRNPKIKYSLLLRFSLVILMALSITSVCYASLPDTLSITMDATIHVPQYVITFDDNGGAGGNPFAVYTASSNDTIAQLKGTAPTRNGYTLTDYKVTSATGGGWTNGTTYASSTSVNGKTAHVTLQAQWSLTQYTITFNDNGGSGGNATANYNITSNTTIETLAGTKTRSGYTLTGYKVTSATGGDWTNNTIYAPNTNVNGKYANVTLEAQWENITYTIAYNNNNGIDTDTTAGAAPASQTKTYGTNLTLQGAISKPGYVFLGWTTGQSTYSTSGTPNGTRYTAGSSLTTDLSSTQGAIVTLYANYRPIAGTINYYDNVSISGRNITSSRSGSTGSNTIYFGQANTLSTNGFVVTINGNNGSGASGSGNLGWDSWELDSPGYVNSRTFYSALFSSNNIEINASGTNGTGYGTSISKAQTATILGTGTSDVSKSMYVKWSASGSFSACLVEGTDILMANLEAKKIEELKMGDKILNYDFFEGKYVENEIIFIEENKAKDITECRLVFENGKSVGFQDVQTFFNASKREYVKITCDDDRYIGDDFLYTYIEDGEVKHIKTKLVKIEKIDRKIRSFSIIASKNFSVIANGFHSIEPLEIWEFANMFKIIEKDGMYRYSKYDIWWKMLIPKFNLKIKTLPNGRFTHQQFNEQVCEVSDAEWVAYRGEFLSLVCSTACTPAELKDLIEENIHNLKNQILK